MSVCLFGTQSGPLTRCLSRASDPTDSPSSSIQVGRPGPWTSFLLPGSWSRPGSGRVPWVNSGYLSSDIVKVCLCRTTTVRHRKIKQPLSQGLCKGGPVLVRDYHRRLLYPTSFLEVSRHRTIGLVWSPRCRSRRVQDRYSLHYSLSSTDLTCVEKSCSGSILSVWHLFHQSGVVCVRQTGTNGSPRRVHKTNMGIKGKKKDRGREEGFLRFTGPRPDSRTCVVPRNGERVVFDN